MHTMKYVLLFLTVFHFNGYAQKIDTLDIMNQVNVLQNADAIQNALHSIISEDQQFRGNQTNDSLDLHHLIWVLYFVNKFGYPSKEFYGHDAFATSVIWIHNHRRLRIISFPIILKGFLSGQINEKDLRDYYLRTIYTYKYEDDDYLRMPLKALFEKLELNTSNTISAEALLNISTELVAFENQPKEIVGIWKSDKTSKTYDNNGQHINVEFEGERVEIFKLPDENIYIRLSSSYGSREPHELYLTTQNEYKYKTMETDRYYTIEGEELYLKKDEQVIMKYKKTN
jgi:hypothetical protein